MVLPFISTLPLESKNPLLVVVVVVGPVKLPTSIEPEFSVTTPPVNVVSDSVQPPTFPPVNDTSETSYLTIILNLPSFGFETIVGQE